MRLRFYIFLVINSFLITYAQDEPMFLYKIISPESWHTSQEKHKLILNADDHSFIHFSTEEQLPRILEKYWRNKEHIVLKVNTALLPGELVLESNRPGGDKYYHLYNGCIPISAAIKMKDE